MPVYEYQCPECGEEKDLYLTLEEYNKSILCSTCSSTMKKKVSKISFGFVNQFKERETKAQEKGFIIREPGLDKDAERAKEYKEQERRSKIRKEVENTVRDMVI